MFLPLICLGQQLTNFNIEDGLAQSQVRSIFQDSRGILWIGTSGGGVSKYDGLEFTNFSTSNGLSNNIVTSIIEDHTGAIWFATFDGACKYDGKTFSILSKDDGLASNIVFSILEDREGNLWFGTEGGVSKYDGTGFTNLARKDELPDSNIMTMIEDRDGNVWFGTDGGGVFRYDGKTFSILSKDDGLASNTVLSILEDQEGNLWFGTDGGVTKYDGTGFTNFNGKVGLGTFSVRSIIQDREGCLWFGTDGRGALRYDGITITRLTEEDGLSSNTVWSILQDREGNLWFGTYRGGLDKYRPSPFTHFTVKNGLSDDIVRAILEDQKGNLWFGTYRGGVTKYDGNTFTNFSTKDGLVDNFVLTIFEDREGNLWFGTYRGVSKFNGKSFVNLTGNDGLNDDIVRSILEDQGGNLWFGTNSGGICRFDGEKITSFTSEDGLNSNEIMTIFEDRNGNIWVGTDKGICVFNGRGFINFSEENGLKENEFIYVILEDFEGNMWFGSYGGGIIRYTPSRMEHPEQSGNHEWGGSFLSITNKEGLYKDNVVSMILDDAGSLWIGTEEGVDRLNIEQIENKNGMLFQHYGKDEGFPGLECIHNSILKDVRGNIWFGTLRGAVKYSPLDDRKNETEPLTHINNLRIFFDEVEWSGHTEKFTGDGLPIGLKLVHNQNHVTFDFVGISLAIPEKVRYSYKLAEFDKTWSPIQKETTATYSNLPPGKYVFQVKACNNDGVWNKIPASFDFEISPPFWKTWWFYALVVLFGTGSLRAYTNFRVRKLERINLELEKLTLVASKTKNAVMIADAKGRIEWVNEGFVKLTGYSLEELKDSKKGTIAEVISVSDIAEISKNGDIHNKSVTYESEIDTKDGKKIWISLSITPICEKNNELKKLVVIGADITKSKLAEEALKKSEMKYRALFDYANDAVFLLNLEGSHVTVNKKAADMLGYSIDELIGKSFRDIVAPGEYGKAQDKLKALLDGKTIPVYERIFRKKDGTEFPVEINVALVYDPENRPLFIQSVVRDITIRKQAENKIKASLQEKDVMLREIHHRVKNNMQIILSLLRLQARSIKQKDIIEKFKVSQNRIKSMALIHETLYRSDDLGRIDFSSYVDRLSTHLLSMYRIKVEDININHEVKNVFLNINRAIPCGLIISELVSNSLEHGLPDGMTGEIFIKMSGT